MEEFTDNSNHSASSDQSAFNNSARRTFIKQVLFLGLAAGFAPSFHCKNKEVAGQVYLGTGLSPYKVWEEMLMALETSSDHLEGRYKKLIAEGNTKAMFDFVRDEIFLMPNRPIDLSGMQTEMRYGIKGALRYGFATPREKVELLNEMYTKAGITSKVVYEIANIPIEKTPSMFFRPIERNFNPIIDKTTWERWGQELGAKGNPEDVPLVDPNLSLSKKLGSDLWAAFPDKENIFHHSFHYSWDYYLNGTPTVEFESEGNTLYAHLFDPEVSFGKTWNAIDPNIIPAKEPELIEEKISVSVSFRNGLAPEEEKELVSGEWFVHELVGNRIGLSFLHGLSLEDQAQNAIGELRTFTPALSLQGFDLDLPYMEERSFLGNPFTLEGKVIDISQDKIKVGNNELLEKSNKDLQKEVVKLDIKAVPGIFPLVKLEVTPTNSSGKFVEGLASSDFRITDNELPVKALMESNQQTPRVVILYDISGSMPLDYQDEGMSAFVEGLEASILTIYPAAHLEKWPTDSSLFGWLLKTSQASNDLIIFATDGDNFDEYNPAMEAVYRNGSPAIVLSVYDKPSVFFDQMAELTGGIILNAKDKEETIVQVCSYLKEMTVSPYVFTYYATDKESLHNVNLKIDAGRLDRNTNYKFDVNIKDDHPLGQNIAGLYLTVKWGGNEVRRVLAGWTDNKMNVPTQRDLMEVRNTILGGALISIEGEGPTLSAALSDLLKYRLSTRAVGEALINGEDDKAIQEFEKGGFQYHSLFIPLMAPIEQGVTKKSFTFAAGPRIGIVKNKIGIDEEFSSLSFDYLPTSNYITLSEDKLEGFRTTIEKTAQLAIREGTCFEESTYSLLEGKSLIDLAKAKEDRWFYTSPEIEKSAFWMHQVYYGKYDNYLNSYTPYTFFDDSASVQTYWQIHHATGELYGILSNGTGGGANSTKEQLDNLNKVVSVYMKYADLAGGGGPALGIVSAYGMTLVQLYAIVSETLIVMDAGGMDEKLKAAIIEGIKGYIKDTTMDIFFGLGGDVGKAASHISFLYSLLK